MWGGCPARAPPDVNQIETEVTWEEERVHQDSLDLVKSPSPGVGGGWGRWAPFSPASTSPITRDPQRASRTVSRSPGFPTALAVFQAYGATAGEVVPLPPGAGGAFTVFHREQPAGTNAAMGATSAACVLSWGSALLCGSATHVCC